MKAARKKKKNNFLEPEKMFFCKAGLVWVSWKQCGKKYTSCRKGGVGTVGGAVGSGGWRRWTVSGSFLAILAIFVVDGWWPCFWQTCQRRRSSVGRALGQGVGIAGSPSMYEKYNFSLLPVFGESNVSGPQVYPHIDFAWVGSSPSAENNNLSELEKVFFCKASVFFQSLGTTMFQVPKSIHT